MSETLLARYPVRVHLVTPAIVERTVARRGVAGILTATERATLDALPVARRQRDWFAGRVAVKRALRAVCRENGEPVPAYVAIEIMNHDSGAPAFTIEDRPELTERLNISIAHTDGAAVAAVADTRASGTVGVDVETEKPLPLELLRRVLRPTELDRLGAAGVHPSPLTMWTAKEAALKAAHRFCGALRDVELTWTGPRSLGARVVGARIRPHTILVRHRSAGPYTVAVASCQ